MPAKLAVVLGLMLLSGGATAPTVPWNVFNRQWGTGFEDTAVGVTLQGASVYVVGATRGALPGQVSAGNWDPFIRRYDTSGNEIWTRQFGAVDFPAFDIPGGVAAVPGAAYIVGTTPGTLPAQVSQIGFDAFIRKYDEDGNELWTRQFGGVYAPLMGADDFGNAVAADSTGVYVVGETEAPLDGQVDAGGFDAFIRKYDHDGNILWTRQFGTAEDETGASVSIDASGVYVVGDTFGTLPGQTRTTTEKEGFIRKYDTHGDEAWTRQFAPEVAPNPAVAVATSVATHAGRVYIGGRSRGTSPGARGDFFVRAYDADGAVLWMRKSLGEAFFASRTASLAVDASGISFVSASYLSLTAPAGQVVTGAEEAFIRRYDFDGNERWTRQFVLGAASGVAADATGIYIVGDTSGTLPGQTHAGDADAFLVKIFESSKLDDSPPVLTCSEPPKVCTYRAPRNESVTATVVDDGGAGAMSAVVLAVIDGTNVLPGPGSVTVTTMDWAGNVTSTLCWYSVIYRFEFRPPTAAPPVLNVVEAGRTLPIRWMTTDGQNSFIIDPNHFRGITARVVPCEAGAPENPGNPSLKLKRELTMQIDGSWQFPWESPNAAEGTCQELTVHLDDQEPGRVILAKVILKEKKDKDRP